MADSRMLHESLWNEVYLLYCESRIVDLIPSESESDASAWFGTRIPRRLYSLSSSSIPPRVSNLHVERTWQVQLDPRQELAVDGHTTTESLLVFAHAYNHRISSRFRTRMRGQIVLSSSLRLGQPFHQLHSKRDIGKLLGYNFRTVLQRGRLS
jgi:hypothetical protein